MQSGEQNDRLAQIEQALSQLTKGLERMELLEVLDRVSQANYVDPDSLQRWTRVRWADGSINTEIVQIYVLRSLNGRFRRGGRVVVGDHNWQDDEVKSKDV